MTHQSVSYRTFLKQNLFKRFPKKESLPGFKLNIAQIILVTPSWEYLIFLATMGAKFASFFF